MSLTDEEKSRILDEERVRAAARATAEAEVRPKAPEPKKSHKLRNAVIACVLVGGCMVAMGKSGNKVQQQGGDPQAQQAAEKPIAITAATLVAAYKANEVAADKKYKDRLLDVTGRVDSISKGIGGGIYITLDSGQQFDFRSVQAFPSDEYENKAAKLNKGAKITIHGRCDGLMGNVMIKEATF